MCGVRVEDLRGQAGQMARLKWYDDEVARRGRMEIRCAQADQSQTLIATRRHRGSHWFSTEWPRRPKSAGRARALKSLH
jgi:hypothetical protein